MKFLHKISLRLRVHVTVVLLLLLMLISSAIAVYHLSKKRIMENAQKQMEVFLENISQIIALNTNGTLDYTAYNAIKPVFNRPAFYTSDYPFLVDYSGNLLIHLYKEGQKYPPELLNQMISNPDKAGFFDTKEYRNNRSETCRVYYRKTDGLKAYIGISVSKSEITKGLKTTTLLLLALFLACVLIAILLTSIVLSPVLRAVKSISESLTRMGRGEIPPAIPYGNDDEIGRIVRPLNTVIEGIDRVTIFANEIGNNKLDNSFTPLGPNDKLGITLLNLKNYLKDKLAEEEKRKVEDERRIWVNTGLAKFSDILRQNNANLQLLSDSIVQNLVNYLDANQGGLFLLNDDKNDEPHLELVSSFAFNRKKAKKKTILIGEGLVGNCVVERHSVYLKEVPENYIEIASGLGDAPPRSLLIVPLKLEDNVFGVVEIASFHEFLPHHIEFVEKIGESIASTLSAVKNSIRTNELLDQSQQQREAMLAQEEEMRQNMEEMQATQEEMARKTLEMEGVTSAINESLLYGELDEHGIFIASNANLQNSLGYSKQELEGKTLFDYIHPNDLPILQPIWEEVNTGVPFKGTIQWVSRKQEDIFILCNITPSFDEYGNLYKAFLLGQDITQSKLLEFKTQQQAEKIEQNLLEIQFEQEQLQQREEEMKSLLMALDTTCLVAEVAPDGRITFINSKNVETLGDSKEQIEGKFHHDIDFQARTQPEKYKAFWNDLLNGIPRQREFSLNVKGRTIWISEFYTPIRDSGGVVIKIIIIGFDITQSKEVEQRFAQRIEELMKMLNK